MARELVYTSVPRGLFPGTMGFCVVACSKGLSEMETGALEKLSGYRRTIEADGSTSVVYSHLLVENGSRTLRVLSRIADAGVDYSGRDNKIASHLLLDADDLISAGPARLCSLSNLFYGRWIDAPRFFEAPRKLPSLGDPPNERPEWFRQTGDRGWAGALAATVLSGRPVVLVVDSTRRVLELYQEAIALLEPRYRWSATFTTDYSKLLPGVRCQWKAVRKGTPEERDARSIYGALVVDLTDPDALPDPSSVDDSIYASRLVASARSGDSGSVPAPVSHSPSSRPVESRRSESCDRASEKPREEDETLARAVRTLVRNREETTAAPPVIVRDRDAERGRRSLKARFFSKTWLWIVIGAILGLSTILVRFLATGENPFAGKTPIAETSGEDSDESVAKSDGRDSSDPLLFGEEEDAERDFAAPRAPSKSRESSAKPIASAPKSTKSSVVPPTISERSSESASRSYDYANEEEEDDFFSEPRASRSVSSSSSESSAYATTSDKARLAEAVEVLNARGGSVDFGVFEGGILYEDAPEDENQPTLCNAALVCERGAARLDVFCDLELDADGKGRFVDSKERVARKTFDFLKKEPSVRFEIEANGKRGYLELALERGTRDRDARLVYRVSDKETTAYLLSVARLRWRFDALSSGDSYRFETSEVQLLKPREYDEDEKIPLEPMYEISSALRSERPQLIDMESAWDGKSKATVLAIGLLEDESEKTTGLSSDAKNGKAIYIFDLTLSDGEKVPCLAVEFEKSSNKKFIERKRIFAGEPKLEFEIQKHYRDKGSVPSYNVSGRPLTFNEAISRQVDVSTRAARELRDETRTFGIYLASPNRRGEGRRKSGVLLATAKVGDETKLETESRFESRGER